MALEMFEAREIVTADDLLDIAQAVLQTAKTKEYPNSSSNETLHPQAYHSTTSSDPKEEAATPEDKSPTTFFDLPAEIRNSIYAFAVLREHVVEGSEFDVGLVPIHIPEPPLLRVNRQIRSEALSIFYGYNTFRCDGSISAGRFLERLPAKKLQALRTVNVWDAVCARFSAHLWLDMARKGIRNMLQDLDGARLRADALLAPFIVEGEDDIVWASLEDMEDLEVRKKGRDWFIVRK